MKTTFVTLSGGTELEVSGRVFDAEPDVGIMSPNVEEWEIHSINGIKCLPCFGQLQALYDTIESDWCLRQQVECAIIDACFVQEDYDYDCI